MSFFSDRSGTGKVSAPAASPTAVPPPIRRVPLIVDDVSARREPHCPGIYIPPGVNEPHSIALDPRLERKILRHLALNFTPRLKTKRPASILFVVGPTGVGKSMAAETVAGRNGIGVLKLAGADLGGSNPALEGAPVQTLNALFAWVEWNSTVNGQKTCVLIDDIDASIVPERPDTTGTNNTDQLRGKLQTTADRADAPCQIWTGNSSRHFHPALLRPGRCELFRYEPDATTKAELVRHIFKPATDRDQRHLQRVAHKYRHRPIAWFAGLRLALQDSAIDAVLERAGLDFTALDDAAGQPDRLDIDALHAAAARADADQGGDFSH